MRDKSRIASIIFGYGGAKDIINRHIKIWKKNCDVLVFVMPEDNYYIVPDHYTLIHEKSNHHGQAIVNRTLFAFKKALELDADIFYFMEYDAMILKHPPVTEDRQIQANLFNSDPNYCLDGYYFKGKFFCHTPYVFTRSALEHFCSVADLDPLELGWPDRWFGAQLEKHNIDVFSFIQNGEGFSQNTIYDPKILEQEIKQGKYAIHGVKTKEVFDVIKDI